jgi:class 3 adenylate cyclase/tetratricopeptide (TPR) repeat protein
MYCLKCNRHYGPTVVNCVACCEPLRKRASTRRPAEPAPTSRPERRPMTALFCDLVDSVGMSVRLDPEDLMRVLDVYLGHCDRIVTHHSGYLARFLGDGILAYFGYPQANEDDAVNAVNAGLAILDSIRDMDPALGASLQARVGIATGLVVVSDRVSRANNRATEIMGKMPNLAARLQSIARPGTVVIADSTRRVTRGTFSYRDLGSISLKGFTKPVQAWEVTQSGAAESRYSARAQGQTLPFVGRNRELDILIGNWTKAREGHGQVVQVIGEAGIGKSCLAETLEQRLAGEPHMRVRWFCSPQHGDSTLHPVIEQLQRAASFERQDPAAVRFDKLFRLLSQTGEPDEIALAALAALLSIPFDRPSPLDMLTPEKRKQVTLDALMTQFAQMRVLAPVMVIVEDLQWVDATTLELLNLLVQQTPESRVLVIISARPEFKPRWTELPFVSVLKLGRLDPASSEELCKQAGGKALSHSLLCQIVERSDGIPLYVEELTRTVVESLESGEDQTSDLSNDSGTAIPLSLHDSLVARLDRLGAARQLANIGAVIGRKFNSELLSAVASKLGVEIRSGLRQLTLSGLVTQLGRSPANSYMFRHALIRDAAYDSLLRTDRQLLHGEIGSVLREKFPDLVATEPEIAAYHLSQSTTPTEAVFYWEKAGQLATSRGAHRDAAVHYGAALDIIRKQDDGFEREQRELSLLLPLAIGLSSSRGYAVDEVRDVLTQARNICDRLGNVSALYPVLRGLCTFYITRNDLDIAEELARRCILIGEETGNIPYLIEGDNALGYVLFGRGELGQARIHLERALRLYDGNEHLGLVFPTEQDPKMTCASLLTLTLHMQGDSDGAAAKCEQSVAWARRLNRPFDLAYALVFASQYCTLSEDYLKAKTLAEESMNISQTHGFGLWYLCGQLELGCAIAHLGQIEEAIEILEPGLARWAAIGCKFNSCFNMGELAHCYAAAGRLELARSTIDAAIHKPDNPGDLAYLSFLHLIRADIMAKSPDPDCDQVERELRLAVSIARSQGAAMMEAEALVRLNEILAKQSLPRLESSAPF